MKNSILLDPTLGLVPLQFQHHCPLLSEFSIFSMKYGMSLTSYSSHI